MTTVANPQASEQSAPQPDQGTEEGIRRAAEIYRNAGIRWDNELLSAIAAEFPSIAAVRDALREIESEGGAR